MRSKTENLYVFEMISGKYKGVEVSLHFENIGKCLSKNLPKSPNVMGSKIWKGEQYETILHSKKHW